MSKKFSVEHILKKDEILYKLARLVRNTDCIHPTTKGRMEGDLLCQLRIIDGEKYDKLVIGKETYEEAFNRITDKIQDAIGEENETT